MIDIQQLIDKDKELLLFLNGSDSLFWDGFMSVVTDTKTWIPSAIILLYVILKNNKLAQSITIIVMLALAITFADQIASSICKPYFARFRPAQDPELMYLVDVVNGYRGGMYGFISSHAANTFAVAVFVSLLIRNKWLTIMMLGWAFIPSYSRIYLGVHYPGDILCGALVGSIVSVLLYLLYTYIQKRYFFQSQGYVSTQYTSSRYEISDIQVLNMVLLVTYFYAVVAGMVVGVNC